MNHPAVIENYYQPYDIETISCDNTDKYKATIQLFKAPYHKINKFWNKYKVSIYDTKTNEVLHEFNRNYGYMPNMIYVQKDNEEFIITTGAYQCISIYNITRNEFKDYVYPNDEAYDWGDGYCPTWFEWKDNNLIIYGSLFDGPPQKMTIFDPDLNNLNFNSILLEDNDAI